MTAKNKPTKIQNFKILEAFVQCNFLDGFTYIDQAGDIINSFTRENKEVPKFNMGLEGLTIFEYTETIKEFKVSSNSIWLHFVEPKNIGDVSTQASTLINRLTGIIKPTMYSRIGWRTYFAREDVSQSNENPTDNLKISKDIAGYEVQKLVISRQIEDLDVRLEISPLTNVENPKKKALLFDVDLAKAIKTLDAKPSLEDIRNTLRSDELMITFEELLKNA